VPDLAGFADGIVTSFEELEKVAGQAPR
jgi:hypothetical protein